MSLLTNSNTRPRRVAPRWMISRFGILFFSGMLMGQGLKDATVTQFAQPGILASLACFLLYVLLEKRRVRRRNRQQRHALEHCVHRLHDRIDKQIAVTQQRVHRRPTPTTAVA